LNNTPYLEYLYVTQIQPDGCHIIYDLETEDTELEQYKESSADELALGGIYPFEEAFEDSIPTLLAGGRIDIIESNDTFGWLLTGYEPLYDDSGKCTAYIGIDISMLGVESSTRFLLVWLVAVTMIFLAIITIVGIVAQKHARQAEHYAEIEKQNKRDQKLLHEVITAFANSIDAKDKYTHGHSSRVAEYSKKLAEMNNKSEQECEEIYYAALLHDIGKIGVPDGIITKDGKLTDEEYEKIKQHPALGAQILNSITEFPYLSIGAGGHHERYDGKGYPHHLKGTDIPEIARIVSVADAYDAMSSKRSYRDPIPQQKVREEIVKGSGTQFDPEYARLMLHLIDIDTEYEMSEREEVTEMNGEIELIADEHRSDISTGILITSCMTTIRMTVSANEKTPGKEPLPSMILFDSLDGREHDTEKEIRDLNYFEYGEVWFDGKTVTAGARLMKTTVTNFGSSDLLKNNGYKIEAVRIKDHALIRITGKMQTAEVIIALPDCTRYLYIGLTGENCRISNISTEKSETEIPADHIPRIAEEVSFIRNEPTGDIPNIQIDDYRMAHSEGIPITDGLILTFHSKCLPTARLVWHCPFIDIFSSDDGVVYGESYRDLAFMRFDGEFWECDPTCHADLNVTKTNAFEGWDAWKKYNHDGYDATVEFKVEDNTITIITENAGISISNTAVITGIAKTIYASVTGDQIAITNIRIGKKQ
ncbi:MAG: HD-GYP domain-containing protein, partial [Ruminiclostridium sp.]|nr:HD-GYP domain-containing protein [Ruminiclostridium sp.]